MGYYYLLFLSKLLASIQTTMPYKATFEDDDSSDSEHVQTDHELFPLLTNHSIPEPASSQTALSRSFPIPTESTPQIMSCMIPRGNLSVVKPLLEMRYLSMYSYVCNEISR